MNALLVFLLALVSCVYCGGTQSYRVTGQLMCDNKPMQDVCVKLWNKNIGLDSVMGSCKTDSQGRFTCQGYATEWFGKIKPKLKIYHRCHKTLGYRKVKFGLPKDKITHGQKTPQQTHEMGSLSLNTKYPGEETELYLGSFGKC